MASEMRAIAVVETQNGPSLELTTVRRPTPLPTQVLIRVGAAGINRADLRRTQAHFKVSGPVIAGLEAAGEVVEVGEQVVDFAPGDMVAAMAPAAYAEYAVAEDVSTMKLPQGTDAVSGAALSTWFMTGHDALVTAGEFRRGDRVLVTAARSGIGIATAQCVKALGAEQLIGSARSGGDLPAFKALGWDAVVGGTADELRAGVAEATGGEGVDVVIDMVGAGLLDALLDACGHGGRIVSVGRMGGFHDTLDLDKLALKRVKIVGVTFRTRSREEKRTVRDAMIRDLWQPIEEGRLKPLIDRTFPLEKALAAQEYVAANRHFGKVVLTV